MQVQSATEPPKKLAAGERAVDGRRQRLQSVPDGKERGQPVEVVYPVEGTPLIASPMRDVQDRRPIPNAARLFRAGCMSARGPAVPRRLRAASIRSIRRSRTSRAAARCREIKTDEGRSRRGREAGRGDQGALCEDLQGVSAVTADVPGPCFATTTAAPRCGSTCRWLDPASPFCRVVALLASDRAADGWLVYYSLSPTRQGALDARQLRHAVHRSELRRSADHHADHRRLGRA